MFEQKEEVIKTIKWHGEGNVEIEVESGWCFSGAKRKDFWNPDEKWEQILKPGSKIREWTVQWSRVIGFEVWIENKKDWGKNQRDNWRPVWCVGNDFETKAERKKSEDGYVNFIKKEGNRIAKFIDQGKSLKQIDKLIAKGHSGNTHACALGIGISKAKNKENADRVRKEHNEFWGVKEGKGLVNPAILTVATK
jgi:hypothetical protein